MIVSRNWVANVFVVVCMASVGIFSLVHGAEVYHGVIKPGDDIDKALQKLSDDIQAGNAAAHIPASSWRNAPGTVLRQLGSLFRGGERAAPAAGESVKSDEQHMHEIQQIKNRFFEACAAANPDIAMVKKYVIDFEMLANTYYQRPGKTVKSIQEIRYDLVHRKIKSSSYFTEDAKIADVECSPLEIAINTNNAAVARYLLDLSPVEPSYLDDFVVAILPTRNYNGEPFTKMVALLVEKGALIGEFRAVEWGADVVKRLLVRSKQDKKDFFDCRDGKTRNSALHRAADKGDLEVVDLILSQEGVDVGALIKAVNKAGKTARDLVREHLSEDLTVWERRDYDMIERLLLERANPDDVEAHDEDEKAWTNADATAAITYVQEGNINALKELCARGFSLNVRFLKGRTPMMLAALKGQTEMVKYLHTQVPDMLNLTDLYSFTAAHYAAEHEETFTALVKLGADLNIKDNLLKLTPLQRLSKARKDRAYAAAKSHPEAKREEPAARPIPNVSVLQINTGEDDHVSAKIAQRVAGKLRAQGMSVESSVVGGVEGISQHIDTIRANLKAGSHSSTQPHAQAHQEKPATDKAEVVLKALESIHTDFRRACVRGEVEVVKNMLVALEQELVRDSDEQKRAVQMADFKTFCSTMVNSAFDGTVVLGQGKPRKFHDSPLAMAIKLNHVDLTHYLLGIVEPGLIFESIIAQLSPAHKNYGKMIALLMVNGAYIEVPRAIDWGVDVVRQLLSSKEGRKRLIDYLDDVGNTALHVAAEKGDPEVVELLLGQKGVDAGALNASFRILSRADRRNKKKAPLYRGCTAKDIVEDRLEADLKPDEREKYIRIKELLSAHEQPEVAALAAHQGAPVVVAKAVAKKKDGKTQYERDQERHAQKLARKKILEEQSALQAAAEQEHKRAQAMKEAERVEQEQKQRDECARVMMGEQERIKQQRMAKSAEKKERRKNKKELDLKQERVERVIAGKQIELIKDAVQHNYQQERAHSDMITRREEIQIREHAIQKAIQLAEQGRAERIQDAEQRRAEQEWRAYIRLQEGKRAAGAELVRSKAARPLHAVRVQRTALPLLQNDALIEAVREGRYGCLYGLARAGIDPEYRGADYKTVYAALREQYENKHISLDELKHLQAEIDTAAKRFMEDKKALLRAALEGDQEILATLHARYKKNAFINRVEFPLENERWDLVNAFGNDGRTALEVAVTAGHFNFANDFLQKFPTAIASKNSSLVPLLLDDTKWVATPDDGALTTWPVALLKNEYRDVPGAQELMNRLVPLSTNPAYIPGGRYNSLELYQACS